MTIAMRIMISSEEIQAKVKQLGEKSMHYAQSDKELVLIGLLRGSVILWQICAVPLKSRMNSIL